MKKTIAIFSMMTVLAAVIYPEVFKFKYVQGQKQRVECTIHGIQFINGVFQSEYDQVYKTISTVNRVENNIALINEENSYYVSYAKNLINEISKTVNVSYSRDQKGAMIVKNTSIFPTLRNIPMFPDEDMKPGYKWNLSGFEAQNIFEDEYVSLFPADVYYEYVGNETVNGRNCAKINYEFTIDIVNNGKMNIDKRISRVLGNSRTEMFFDNANGGKVKENYERHYFFIITDGTNSSAAEFVDEGTRVWYPVELMQKDKLLNDLNKELKDRKLNDTTIQKDDRGIKISLENIQFQPESSILLDTEKTRLDKIAAILKKYKDKGLMIVGHTTDKGTEEGRQRLSAERAKVVTEYLLKKDAVDPSKTTYLGKGGMEPIADNTTEEGMKKNRRVEIYILEE
jgi:outer membrane protein OmpA-like peptidoglycan-associated protein